MRAKNVQALEIWILADTFVHGRRKGIILLLELRFRLRLGERRDGEKKQRKNLDVHFGFRSNVLENVRIE